MASHGNNKQQSAICPACGSRLRFRHPLQVGEFIACDECDTELEVIRLEPLKLDWAYDEPIDDDDEDDWSFDNDEEEFVDAEG